MTIETKCEHAEEFEMWRGYPSDIYTCGKIRKKEGYCQLAVPIGDLYFCTEKAKPKQERNLDGI